MHLRLLLWRTEESSLGSTAAKLTNNTLNRWKKLLDVNMVAIANQHFKHNIVTFSGLYNLS